MSFTLGGKTAAELGLILLKSSQRPTLPQTRDRTLTIPGRHGAYDFGADLEPKQFNLDCAILMRTAAELQDAVDALAAHLLDGYGRPRTMELFFDQRPDRAYAVRYTGSLDIERAVGTGQFTLSLTAFDPFPKSRFSSSEVILLDDDTIILDSDIRLDDVWEFAINTPTTVEVNNFGVLNVRPLIKITGSFSSISVTAAGNTLAYNAPMTAQTLHLDCGGYTAKIGSVNKLAHTTGIDRFMLPRGVSNIEIGGSGLNCTVLFDFRAIYT